MPIKSQYISGSAGDICPLDNNKLNYDATGFPDNCKFNWSTENGDIFVGETNHGDDLLGTIRTELEIKWNKEPSYDNSGVGYYPYGKVEVITTGCTKVDQGGNTIPAPENDGKYASLKLAITSVKDYEMSDIRVNGSPKFNGEEINFTNNNNNVTVSIYITERILYYPEGTFHWGGSVEATDFKWTLPAGWTAIGHGTSSSFVAGPDITLVQPCWGISHGTTGDFKVALLNPEECVDGSGNWQKGKEFVLKLQKDAPYVTSVSSSISTIQWGATVTFTLTANTNRTVPDMLYVWQLPDGFYKAGTSQTGEIPTSSKTLNVTTYGCNTTEQIQVKVQGCTSSGGGQSLYTSTNLKFADPYLVGPNLVCAGGEKFEIKNYGAGTTINWTYSSNLEQGYGGTNFIGLKAKTNGGTGWVKAILTNGCGSKTLNYNNFYVGTQKPGPITFQMDAPPHRFTASIDGAPTANSYNWYVDYVAHSWHTDVIICQRRPPYCGNGYFVQVESINQCGTSDKRNRTAVEPPCSKKINISPNPASDFIEISFENKIEIITDDSISNQEAQIITSPDIYNVSITNLCGVKIYETKESGNVFTIPTSNIKNGIYILVISNNEMKTQELISIEH